MHLKKLDPNIESCLLRQVPKGSLAGIHRQAQERRPQDEID